PQPPHTLELEDVHRLAHALHSESSEIVEAEVPGDERRRGFGEIYLARLSKVLHPRRETDRVPLRRIVHAQVVSDLPDDNLARVEAHPGREPEPALAVELLRVAPQFLTEVQRGVTRSLCMILVRDRRPEQSHDAVAGVLIDRALETMNTFGEDREEAVHDLVPFLG